MVGVNIIAAGSDDEARRLATTQQMSFTNIFRATRGLGQPPIDDIENYWSPALESAGYGYARALHPWFALAPQAANLNKYASARPNRLSSVGQLVFLTPRPVAKC
jgi:hypothetical protein